MTDLFSVELSDRELHEMSVLGLAHMGDCVYELLVRTWLCTHGRVTSHGLHKEKLTFVSAPAQAEAMQKILPVLTEQEQAVFKRGRNAKVHSVPKNAALSQYHKATGLEALFGWLWLKGDRERINQLFDLIMEDNEDAP